MCDSEQLSFTQLVPVFLSSFLSSLDQMCPELEFFVRFLSNSHCVGELLVAPYPHPKCSTGWGLAECHIPHFVDEMVSKLQVVNFLEFTYT